MMHGVNYESAGINSDLITFTSLLFSRNRIINVLVKTYIFFLLLEKAKNNFIKLHIALSFLDY